MWLIMWFVLTNPRGDWGRWGGRGRRTRRRICSASRKRSEYKFYFKLFTCMCYAMHLQSHAHTLSGPSHPHICTLAYYILSHSLPNTSHSQNHSMITGWKMLMWVNGDVIRFSLTDGIAVFLGSKELWHSAYFAGRVCRCTRGVLPEEVHCPREVSSAGWRWLHLRKLLYWNVSRVTFLCCVLFYKHCVVHEVSRWIYICCLLIAS